ncbi:hypothetical protein LCGC14_1285180, partial [marine sediment metagenome]
DQYDLILENTPLFFDDADQGKWLQYLKIYDDNYNYYSVGISGVEYQLLYDSATQSLSWNAEFDKFQDYWGTQIELPAMVEPNIALYVDYCTNTSWNSTIMLDYQNIDYNTIQLTYNFDYSLYPQYEEWYGEIINNNESDYKITQYYLESFNSYTDNDTYSHIFDIDYDLGQDFLNLSLFKIIGFYYNNTNITIASDGVDYDINFDFATKNLTIVDLNPINGNLSQFFTIIAILNFTSGPISSYTVIEFTNYFNQTYLSSIESTFYDFVYTSFEQTSKYNFIFTATPEYNSFESSNYTRNTDLVYTEAFNTQDEFNLYSFDQPQTDTSVREVNGQTEYKQEIDFSTDYKDEALKEDKDITYIITRYGIAEADNPLNIIWYRIIQDFQEHEETTYDPIINQKNTKWFELDYYDVFMTP